MLITINTSDYTNNGQYPQPSGNGAWTLQDSDGCYLPTYYGDYSDAPEYLANTGAGDGTYTLCPSSLAYDN